MPREADPLLPQNESAPEISNYGSRVSHDKFNPSGTVSSVHPTYREVEEEQDSTERDGLATTTPSVVGTTISLLSVVAMFAIFYAFVQSRLKGKHPVPLPSPMHPVPGHPVPGHPFHPVPHRTVEERVRSILSETPLIDGHNDLAIFIRGLYKNDITSTNFRNKFENGGMEAHVDLPRLRKGMVGGAFWSAFVVCPEHASDDFSDQQYATAVSHTIQQIDMIKRLQRQYPQSFTAAGSSITAMMMQFRGRRRMFGQISIEGLHQVSQTSAMSTLRLYYELGVRAATLTWNCHNAFADAALVTENGTTKIAPYHRGGLTAEGRQVVKEMNRLGMLVDISHTSYWTQKAVLSNGTSRAPVVFTHSSAFSICPHPRNVKDDILDLVKDTNSIVMVNFSPDFISCIGNGVDMPEFHKQNSTLHQVARHIVYIGEKIGYDHVGLGSDFDGIESTPEGLDGVDKYPDLIAELLRMNVSDKDASKIAGGNILRVWRKAEEVSLEMQREGIQPGKDEVSGYSRDEI